MNSAINDFWVIGINYRKSDTALRGRFALSEEQQKSILNSAQDYGIQELFILSTCNRTEIYCMINDPTLAITLLCNFTEGDSNEFIKNAYKKQGKEALAHIFNVASGLDSQILGDYEIISQMKLAIQVSKECNCIGQFTDRLFHTVLQSCRAIRSKTKLSVGSVSVAYAAILFLQNQLKDISKSKVLIIGLGKIGITTCKNLLEILSPQQITVMNRTAEKAIILEKEYGINVCSFDLIQSEIKKADIIIVATSAEKPILKKEDFLNLKEKILIDLSIPNNIDPTVKELSNIQLANVDDLSKINDETYRRRLAEVPKAKTFITFYIHQFAEWYMMRQNVPVLKAVKEKLAELNKELAVAEEKRDVEKMQKTINQMALQMRSENPRPGCNYIEALSDYLINISN